MKDECKNMCACSKNVEHPTPPQPHLFRNMKHECKNMCACSKNVNIPTPPHDWRTCVKYVWSMYGSSPFRSTLTWSQKLAYAHGLMARDTDNMYQHPREFKRPTLHQGQEQLSREHLQLKNNESKRQTRWKLHRKENQLRHAGYKRQATHLHQW